MSGAHAGSISTPGAANTTEIQVVEYYNASLDHYFMTGDPAEIDALDSGATRGWARTGSTFGTYASTATAPGASPMCRFYGRPSAGLDSHFYSGSPTECADVVRKFAGAWQFESGNVFKVQMPNTATGECPVGTVAVYRLFNQRTDANHRYTTDANTKSIMVGLGYVSEGYGVSGVAFCATQSSSVPSGNATSPTVRIVATKTAADTYAFSSTATASSNATIVSYTWNFGDGSIANGATATHKYAAAGTYSVLVSVLDSRNASATATVSVTTVGSVPSGDPTTALPTASIFVTQTAPDNFDFGSTATGSGGAAIVAYAWDFGDGNFGSGPVTSHRFALSGTYPVVLIVTDTKGAVGRASRTVTAGTSTPPVSDPVPDSDFARRRNATGVVRSFDFESLGGGDVSKYTYNNYPNMGYFPGASGNPVVDTAIRASGAGSMRFDVPGFSQGGSGSFYVNFSNDLATQFGAAGDEFYVQWRQRFNQAMIDAVINLVDPDTKQVVGLTAIKQAIITTGDVPGRTFNSCTELELVLTSYSMHKLPELYQACGWSIPLIDSIDGGNTHRLQNAMPMPYCTTTQANALGPTGVPPSCFGWVANEWMTFQVGVKLGAKQYAPLGGGTALKWVGSRVRLWGAREGKPSVLLVDMPWDIIAGTTADNQKYGKIFFGPYMTNKDATQAHALLQTWYDEFIVSRTPIADPVVGTLPPESASTTTSQPGSTTTVVTPPVVESPPANVPPPSTAALSTIPAGIVRNLGAFSDGSDPQRARTDYSGFVYDPSGKQMLLFGGGHGPAVDTDIRAFPLASRPSPWTSLYPSTPVSAMVASNQDKSFGRWISTNQPLVRHSFNTSLMIGTRFYMMGAYSDFIGSGPGRISWYDLSTKTWSYSKIVTAPWYYASGAAFDPVSGKVVVYGTDAGASNWLHLWVYDPVADAIIADVPTPTSLTGFSFDLHYVGNNQFIATEMGGRVTEIAFNRVNPTLSTFARAATTGTPPPSSAQGNATGWDGTRLGGFVSSGVFYTYNPATRVWSTQQMKLDDGSNAGMSQVYYNIDFDPDSRCYIFIATDGRTYAYRPL